MAATVEFFKRVGVGAARLSHVHDLPAGHALIAPGAGNDCGANAAPYISHCSVGGKDYDQAGAILRHLYGPLQPRVATPAGKVVEFAQRPYAPASTGMAETGFVYVPAACEAAGAHCRVHIALHGCLQSAQSVGDRFVTGAGYNAWADSQPAAACSIRRSTPRRPRTTNTAAGTGGATPGRTMLTSRRRR